MSNPNFEQMNIYQKLNWVMTKVEYIKKDKAVQGGGQNYNAVAHDAVVALVREHLVTCGILVIPTQTEAEFIQQRDLSKDIKMYFYSATYDVCFLNIHNPDDVFVVSVNANAQDSGDKAPGKAMSYATKYAILKALMIESGDDEESRAEKTRPITETQKKELEKLLDKLPQERHAGFFGFIGHPDLEEIPRSDFKQIHQQLIRAVKQAQEA